MKVYFENGTFTRLLFFLCGFYLQLDIIIHHLDFYLAVRILIFIFMYAEVMKHLLLEYWARVKTSTTLNQNENLVA